MPIPGFHGPKDIMLEGIQASELLKTNEESQKYGLILNYKDAKQIIEARENILRSSGRMEL